MRTGWHAWLVALALAAGAAAQVPAAPAWQLVRTPAACAVRATASDGVGLIAIARAPGQPYTTLSIRDRSIRGLGPGMVSVGTLRAGGATEEIGAAVLDRRQPDAGAVVFTGIVRPVLDAAATGKPVRFDSSIDGSRVGPVTVPALAAGLALLDGCVQAQLVDWGADASQFAPGGKTPGGFDADRLLPQADRARLLAGLSNVDLLTVLRLSRSGRVEGCDMVFVPAGNAAEDRLCAALIGRQVARPARDAAGNPVPGVIAFHPALIRTTRVNG